MKVKNTSTRAAPQVCGGGFPRERQKQNQEALGAQTVPVPLECPVPSEAAGRRVSCYQGREDGARWFIFDLMMRRGGGPPGDSGSVAANSVTSVRHPVTTREGGVGRNQAPHRTLSTTQDKQLTCGNATHSSRNLQPRAQTPPTQGFLQLLQQNSSSAAHS